MLSIAWVSPDCLSSQARVNMTSHPGILKNVRIMCMHHFSGTKRLGKCKLVKVKGKARNKKVTSFTAEKSGDVGSRLQGRRCTMKL